ncbi:MAG: FitA-like ribbon-helix-helix domain-containing protein [Pseudonocardia sp.]
MTTIQVRHVSSSTHHVLRQRAAARGMSMQEYVLALLDEAAARPTVDEVLARAGGRAGGRVGLRQAAEDLRVDREGG